jgi:subtilisin family serine protease
VTTDLTRIPYRLRNAQGKSQPAMTTQAVPMSNVGHDDYLKGASLVTSKDTAPGFDGIFHHVTVYHTNMADPWVRVDQTLSRQANGQDIITREDAEVADHVLVQLQQGHSEQDLQTALAGSGGTISRSLSAPGLYVVQLPTPPTTDTVPNALHGLGVSSSLYKYVEADPLVFVSSVPNDTSFSSQWALNNTGQTGGVSGDDIKAENAWTLINSSPNVVVAVIDTGIDFNHPDLAANIWTNPHPGSVAGYTNDLHGWNFVANNNNPQDDHFHGTHVSGTIGAVGNNGTGVAGVTWSVKIMPLKFLDSTGAGTTSNAINAIYYAVNNGAKILSNSWGGGTFTQSLKDAIDFANSNNVIFIAAAGNDGLNIDSNPVYPASYTSANILAVAATDASDALAGFSNYGNTVALAAPGVGILSTTPVTATSAMTSYGLPTGYGQISGTSMAAPHVSGVAALALAQNPSLTVAQLKNLIMSRVDSQASLAGLVQTSGRLNAYNVVNANYVGSPGQVAINNVTFDDVLGYNDGQASPGEMIDLTPTISNPGGQSVNGVSVQIVPQQPSYATMVTGAQSVGTLLPATNTTLSAFKVQLSSTVPVGATLSFDVQASGTGVAMAHHTTSFVVKAAPAYIEKTVNFSVGEILPDPVRNLVYVVDQTDNKVLAIDTSLGQLVASSSLGVTTGASFMAVSPDGSKLYVSLPTAQKIQVFSLPNLTSQATVPVNFTPYSLVFGTGNRLYVGNNANNWGAVYEINPSTGQVLQTSIGGFELYAPLLRVNSTGTRLYIGETALSGEGVGLMNQVDITGPTATLLNTYNGFNSANLEDFAVDDTNQKLYVMQGGDYHVDVMSESGTGTNLTTWPILGAYGVAVALSQDGQSVWAASGDPYSGGISQYNRSSGAVLNTYAVGINGIPVNRRGVAPTSNGRVLYTKTGSGEGTSIIGIIGATSLNITNLPPVTPGPNLVPGSITFSDVEGNGDGVPNPGEIVDLTPQITNNGGATATNVTLTVTGDSNSAVLTGTQTIASLAAGATAGPANPLRVQISPSAAPATPVTVTFTLSYTSGTTQTFTYQMTLLPSQNNNVTTTNLMVGECMADRLRNVVYIFDKGDLKVLAFDTSAGHITATAALPVSTAINWSSAPASGGFAESIDGTSLFVAIPQTNTIAKYSLPALTLTTSWTFAFSPVSLACDAQGRLYCTTTNASQALVQINGSTGAVICNSGAAFVSSTSNQGSGSILKNNSTGTEIYSSLNNTIYRYSSTGSGTPNQLATYNFSNNLVDFTLNETAGVIYGIVGDGNVWSQLLTGGSPTFWTLATTGYGGDAVTNLPSNTGVMAAYNYSPGYIRYFLPTSGQVVIDDQLNDNYYTTKPRALVSTPNGNVFYVMFDYAGSGSSPDSYLYKVGLIGGSIDFTPPGPTPITLQSIVITDPAPGSNDGLVHPGQTVQLAPVFKNFLNIGLTGVTVSVATTSSYATVQSPSSANIGSVASFGTFSPSSNFNVTIGAGATDGTAIPVTFTVNYNNGSVQTLAYTLYVTNVAMAITQVNFAPGDMLSDPTRNLAYVVDNTNQRLLAIDTAAGTLSKIVRLAAPPANGHLALSADGSHLYIALAGTNQIEAVSLPDMQQSDIFNLSFSPCSLGCASDGKIYATSNAMWDHLYQIDPATGITLGSFGHSTYYSSSVLRLNGSGNTFYVAQTGLSGFGSIDAYTVNSSGLPTYQMAYPFTLSNLFDLQVDDSYQRIYSSSGGVYGVGVTSMSSGTTTTWSGNSNYAPYGCAVAFLPNGTFIYGGSYGSIRRFNRVDGTPLGDFLFEATYPNADLNPRGMAITLNGRILFATSEWTGNSSLGVNGYYYRLGLIGASSLSVTPTTVAPNVYGGVDQSSHLSQAVSLAATASGSTTNLPITWKMVSGPANVSLTSTGTGAATVGFSAAGTYQFKASTTDNSLTGSDLVNIVVQSDLPSVSVNATGPIAVSGVTTGQLNFSRTGAPTGALTVSYTVSGSGRAGIDYVALSGTATIPDGSASVIVPVTGLASAANNSTVNVAVSSSAGYAIGVSQNASVVVESSAYNSNSGNNLGTTSGAGAANTPLTLTAGLLPGNHTGVYYIWYFNNIAIATTASNTYTVTSPQTGTYSYYVFATDTGTTGSGSILVSVTNTTDTPLLPPWGLLALGLMLLFTGTRMLPAVRAQPSFPNR